jgi:hypothetical protein
MSFISILEEIGVIAGEEAPKILAAIDAPLGALVGTVVNAIVLAEAKFGPGTGPDKKQEVLSAIQSAIPLILAVIKAATGKELADASLLAQGFGRMVDAFVGILNSFHILPKARAN